MNSRAHWRKDALPSQVPVSVVESCTASSQRASCSPYCKNLSSGAAPDGSLFRTRSFVPRLCIPEDWVDGSRIVKRASSIGKGDG
jgi:hypothetical protein